MSDQPFVPYISADKNIPEFTIKAIVIGIILGSLLTAANTYLGLYAGMTVSASIPAAVLSMGILRGLFRKGTILENNMVQTIASAGESIAAGAIFTIPALVITGVWTEFKFWPTMLIAVFGGMLGVLFMIPLRRALIVEEQELIYPEGVACAEVLEVGERGGSGIFYVFAALTAGAIFKLLISGIGMFKGVVEGAVRVGKSSFYFGSDISVALLAVGLIVGFNVGTLVFIGGVIAWVFAIPVYGFTAGFPTDGAILDHVWDYWNSHIRFLGVGAMLVGGIWSIIKVRDGIVKGIKGSIAGYKAMEGGSDSRPRTEQDMKITHIGMLLGITALAVFALYIFLTGNVTIGLISGLAMLVMAFFFVAVSSYIVGLVGSSNNPVSGMTICTVLFVSGLLLLLGMKGESGILATLGVAGVVCCAACTAGDCSQDLKTGYLVGATPRRQQWGEIIGILVPAAIIPFVMTVLHGSYGIGVEVTEGVAFLKAPQATLFASITTALFKGGNLPWNMVFFGAVIGVVIIVIDELLRASESSFRAYIMPVAVGIYLPLALSVPIFAGGILALIIGAIAARQGEQNKKDALHRSTILGSGLIAGEALIGIVLGAVIFFGDRALPVKIPFTQGWMGSVLAVIAISLVILAIFQIALKGKKA